MGQPSTIDRLPPDVRKALDGWIYDPAISQTEATERVNALLGEVAPDHPPVSRQAVNRYDLSVRKVKEKILRSREIARLVIADVGSRPSGEVGQMVTEMVKAIIVDVNMLLQDIELDAGSLPGVTRNVRELSLAIERLQRAEKLNEERESEVRERARREAAEAAAGAAERAVAGKGLSAETVAEIRKQVLGVA